jgi:hypothetical protein
MNESNRSGSAHLLVGRNSRGNWVVRDQDGLSGGLFVGRAEALKFARFESRNGARAVITVPDVLELDLSPKAGAGRPAANGKPRARRAVRA